MIESLVKIRIKQFYRGVKGIGFFRIFLLIWLFAFLFFILYKQTETQLNAIIALSIFLFIIFLTHLKRQDKEFLKIHLSNYRVLMLVEYLLLSSPVLICLLAHAHWVLAPILFSTLSFIVNLDFQPKQANLNRDVLNWIPDWDFEWKGEIRKLFFFVVPLWAIALCTSFFIGSVPIAIFVLGMIPLSFIEKNESFQMLIAPELNAKKFLLRKIGRHLIFFSAIITPLVLAFMIFHSDRWYIPIGGYLIFFSLHTFLILTKYTFYEPSRNSPASQIFGVIGAMGAVIPIFLPAVWLLSVWFYFRSQENLKFYLNDYN